MHSELVQVQEAYYCFGFSFQYDWIQCHHLFSYMISWSVLDSLGIICCVPPYVLIMLGQGFLSWPSRSHHDYNVNIQYLRTLKDLPRYLYTLVQTPALMIIGTWLSLMLRNNRTIEPHDSRTWTPQAALIY
ncbi:hypothetical protein F4778DRAFT_13928 [Xylariomycetidae sp. FL2044]|nr:hypothetical protein F4778DRAFT_13928 [Xylariomycetidae sp. FL2044]